jgi:hypothetical protein
MLQYLANLSVGRDPSLPILVIRPCGPISLIWSYAALAKGLDQTSGGAGFIIYKNSIAST